VGPSRVLGMKSRLKEHLRHAWVRAVVFEHVDVAVIRAADVTREVVTDILESPTTIIAVRSGLELDTQPSSFGVCNHVDLLRSVVAVPAPPGRQEAHHPYRVVVNLIILRRNLPGSLFRHVCISRKRIKAPLRLDRLFTYSPKPVTPSLLCRTRRTENRLNCRSGGGFLLCRKQGKHHPMHVSSCHSEKIRRSARPRGFERTT
jgi:hypothetical protein